MNREQTLNALYEMAEIMAKELGCTQTETRDADCGIWDMGSAKMSDMLRREYGEMKDVIFHNGVHRDTKYSRHWEKKVELRFRFANPVLSVQWFKPNGDQCMGSIEMSDSAYEGSELIHTGEYRISEIMSWQPEGFAMSGRLMQMWDDRKGA